MNSLRLNLKLLPLALAAAFAVPASAENLQQLYEMARGYDATWQSSKAQYDANLYRAEQARAGLLPTANATAGLSRSRLEITTPVPTRIWQIKVLVAATPISCPAAHPTTAST